MKRNFFREIEYKLFKIKYSKRLLLERVKFSKVFLYVINNGKETRTFQKSIRRIFRRP